MRIDSPELLIHIVKSKLQVGGRAVVSISGGSDSDIMLDVIYQSGMMHKCKFAFSDTGTEYKATHEHLDYLEKKYSIKIERLKPKKPIPVAVKQHGVPFMTKIVSENLDRLQNHNFQFEDLPFEKLWDKYPKCKSALRWWCNLKSGQNNIKSLNYFKEFLIENKQYFIKGNNEFVRISAKCCNYSKKWALHKFEKENADISLTGVRKEEGGARSVAYTGCFTAPTDKDTKAYYRPLFFMTNKLKSDYEKQFKIVHSDCYTKYGLKRTGCVGCPCTANAENELVAIKEFEPNLYKAGYSIFGKAYMLRRMYNQFKKERV